jgi:hypothetical protein
MILKKKHTNQTDMDKQQDATKLPVDTGRVSSSKNGNIKNYLKNVYLLTQTF